MVYIFTKLVSFGVKTAVRTNFCPPTVVSIIEIITADGSYLPPFLIWKGQQH